MISLLHNAHTHTQTHLSTAQGAYDEVHSMNSGPTLNMNTWTQPEPAAAGICSPVCWQTTHTWPDTHIGLYIPSWLNVCKHWTILSSSHLSPLPLCSHPLSYQDFFCNCRITEWQWLSATQAHCLCSLFVPSQMLSKLGCHLTLLRSANGDCG